MLNITVMYSQHIKRVSTVIQSLPKDTHDSSGCHFSHGAFSAPPSQIPIYLFLHHHSGKLLCKWHTSFSLSCKYYVIGDVNNLFVCLTGRLSNAARFPWFNYCGIGSGENEGWTLNPPVLMTFKVITATCCCGAAHLKARVMKRGALRYGEHN